MVFTIESLKVWKRSVKLSGEISEWSRLFPRAELYALTLPLQRTVDSIVLAGAKGSTVNSTR